jgi:hypothetical protein
MKRVRLLFCAVLIALPAASQVTPPPPGFHEHDGFFLSLSAGPTYASIDNEASSLKLVYSGWGAGFDVRIGGTVAPNFMLSGDLMGWVLENPKVDVSGYGSGSLQNTSFLQSTIGVGVTYYFMPVNMFLAGTVGFAGFSLDANGQTANTDKGLGLYLKVGKDWWVGPDWALGIAGSFGWSSVKNSAGTVSETLSGYSVGIQFNATYQ